MAGKNGSSKLLKISSFEVPEIKFWGCFSGKPWKNPGPSSCETWGAGACGQPGERFETLKILTWKARNGESISWEYIGIYWDINLSLSLYIYIYMLTRPLEPTKRVLLPILTVKNNGFTILFLCPTPDHGGKPFSLVSVQEVRYALS